MIRKKVIDFFKDDTRLAIFLFISVVICAVHYTNERSIYKELGVKSIISGKIFTFSGYRAGHFVLYMILGYFFPRRWIMCLVLGVVWELVELTFRELHDDEWWGEFPKDYLVDLCINMAGFFTGAYIPLICGWP